ncbi:MAG: hypothetical protein ACE5SW_07660, partial [Nitrososphaeraceae archaeon]
MKNITRKVLSIDDKIKELNLKLIGLSFFIVFSLNFFAIYNISDGNINIFSLVIAQTEKEKNSINNDNKELKDSI